MIKKIFDDPPKINSTVLSKTFWRCNNKRFEMVYPNVYLDCWCEADLLGIRRSGYTDEIEIKISKSDYKADFKKTCWWKIKDSDEYSAIHGKQREEVNKHRCLEIKECLPNRFWFLVSPDLVEKIEVPDYAGLLTVRPYEDYWVIHYIKEAPLLHKNKITAMAAQKLDRKLAYRFMDNYLRD